MSAANTWSRQSQKTRAAAKEAPIPHMWVSTPWCGCSRHPPLHWPSITDYNHSPLLCWPLGADGSWWWAGMRVDGQVRRMHSGCSPKLEWMPLGAAWSVLSSSNPGRVTEKQRHLLWRVSPGPLWPGHWVRCQCPKIQAGRAESLQSRASSPTWAGCLRCGSAWVQTTEGFARLRAASPGCLKWETNSYPHSLLNAAFSLHTQGT